MEGVERADAEIGCEALREIYACFPSGKGKLDRGPQTRNTVALEFCPDSLCFNDRETIQKGLPINGVCELHSIEGRDENAMADSETPVGLC